VLQLLDYHCSVASIPPNLESKSGTSFPYFWAEALSHWAFC